MTKGPLLTLSVHEQLMAARAAGTERIQCSLDLGRSTTSVEVRANEWIWNGAQFPFMEACKDRTVYHWHEDAFRAVSRYTSSLIKLIPTEWGAPTFEIDGIKMLPTAKVSPYLDAKRKVGLIQPRDKVVLDCCGGLGYFASWCLINGALKVQSYEKNPDVIWLRGLNPWSPGYDSADVSALTLTQGDISEHIASLPDHSVDAVLHDPPRFGIAGELYSQSFYGHLARVLRQQGRLFHYTGAPNKLTSRRDVPTEVATRLQRAGFSTQLEGDGVLAVKGSNKTSKIF